MRSSQLTLAVATLAWLAAPTLAHEEAPPATGQPVAQAPAAAEAPAAVPQRTPEAQEAAAEDQAPAKSMALGPVGVDEQGRTGRIHVVQPGDTLWDISDAYLGTPWVWPSVWRDNGDIENPDLIHPGDRLWISAHEIRPVTEQEAQELLAGAASESSLPAEDLPAAFQDSDFDPAYDAQVPRETYRYSEIEHMGFVSAHALEAAATIVGGMDGRWMLDPSTWVVIGLGRGEVEVGDRFEIFRPGEAVLDPETHRPFGYATTELGWLEVTQVFDETARAEIRLSRGVVQRGDALRPYQPRSAEITVGPRPEVEGRVVYTPNGRMEMGSADIVYLNRGTRSGLEVGSPLEIYRPLGAAFEPVKQKKLALPDAVVAKLLVVEADADTSVAVVTHTNTELHRGDRFRGSDSIAP